MRDNVRELDQAHVDNLAQSIALRGLLVPLIVSTSRRQLGADELDEDLDVDELAD